MTSPANPPEPSLTAAEMRRLVKVKVTADDRDAPRCDFCSSPDIAFEYACTPFKLVGVEDGPDPAMLPLFEDADGRWAACTQCARFIEANDASGLSLHAVLQMAAAGHYDDSNDEQKAHSIAALLAMHQAFMAHRGARQPV